MTVNRDPERSVCFDAAAAYYDQTRSLPGVGRDSVLEVLLSELLGKKPCLDIGVGTGRIALPLADAGIPVVGVDLSIPMMQQALSKTGKGPQIPLVAGNATALPIRDSTFGSVLIIHVLHSIPRWEHVITEAVRVSRTGATIIVDPGNGGNPMIDAIEARFIEEIAQEPRRSEWNTEKLDEMFQQCGCRPRRVADVPIQFSLAPSEFIARLERGQMSWEWELDASRFGPAGERVRAWARQEFGPLDTPRELTSFVRMRAYDVRSKP